MSSQFCHVLQVSAASSHIRFELVRLFLFTLWSHQDNVARQTQSGGRTQNRISNHLLEESCILFVVWFACVFFLWAGKDLGRLQLCHFNVLCSLCDWWVEAHQRPCIHRFILFSELCSVSPLYRRVQKLIQPCVDELNNVLIQDMLVAFHQHLGFVAFGCSCWIFCALFFFSLSPGSWDKICTQRSRLW